MDKSARAGLITLVIGAAVHGGFIAAAKGISYFVHNTRSVELEGQNYWVGRHGGITTVASTGLSGGYYLTDSTGDGLADIRKDLISVPKRPLISLEREPSEEDQELFASAVLKYDSQLVATS